MNHRICDNEICGMDITKEIEEYRKNGDYLLENNIHFEKLDFCDEDCRKQYHKQFCEPSMNESDQVSSTCLNCGKYDEHPNL